MILKAKSVLRDKFAKDPDYLAYERKRLDRMLVDGIGKALVPYAKIEEYQERSSFLPVMDTHLEATFDLYETLKLELKDVISYIGPKEQAALVVHVSNRALRNKIEKLLPTHGQSAKGGE